MRECCICFCHPKSSLDCRHSICKKCLLKVRSDTCPVCRSPLKGEMITDRVLGQIKRRMTTDRIERENDTDFIFDLDNQDIPEEEIILLNNLMSDRELIEFMYEYFYARAPILSETQ